MIKRFVLKWKIRKIANVLTKCDIETQKECISYIKYIMRTFCVNDHDRKRFVDMMYKIFRESELV